MGAKRWGGGLYVTAPRLTKVPEVVTLVARGEVITQDRNHDPIAASLQSRTSIIRQRTVGLHQSSVGNVGNIFLNFIFTIPQKRLFSYLSK